MLACCSVTLEDFIALTLLSEVSVGWTWLDHVGTTVCLLQAFHSEGHRLDASGCRRGALMAGCRCWCWAGPWFFVGSVSQSVTSHSCNCYCRHPFKFE